MEGAVSTEMPFTAFASRLARVICEKATAEPQGLDLNDRGPGEGVLPLETGMFVEPLRYGNSPLPGLWGSCG